MVNKQKSHDQLVNEILSEMDNLRELGADLSKVRFRKVPTQSDKDWCQEFDKIRTELKESGMNLNIPIVKNG